MERAMVVRPVVVQGGVAKMGASEAAEMEEEVLALATAVVAGTEEIMTRV